MFLRLLCCSSSLEGGGSERQLWQLAVQLPADQFDKQLYLLNRRGPYLEKLPADIPVRAFSDLNFNSRLPGAIHRAQVRQLAGLLKQQQIDVVYDRTYHMTLITSKACRQANIPRVSVIVSPPSRDFALSAERFRWFKYRILRRAYSDPLAITIAVSQAVAEDAARYYHIPLNCLKVIANPVDVDAVQQAAVNSTKSILTATEIRNKRLLRLIVVGRMTEEKGHRLLLETVQLWENSKSKSSLGDLQVDFVGDGPLRQSLERQAVELQIADRVHFRGFQPNPYPWIASADILCIPSLYEGLPNVALEAMALKKPVIATPCGDSLQELIGSENQRGVLLKESSARCLANALQSHLENPTQAVQRAEFAYEWIVLHHGLQNWLSVMSQLLQAAIKMHG